MPIHIKDDIAGISAAIIIGLLIYVKRAFSVKIVSGLFTMKRQEVSKWTGD